MRTVTTIIGFIVLFVLYHAAEYMIVFKNSPVGFLSFQLLFFVAAWGIARWQAKPGLAAWGLGLGGRFMLHLLAGALIGTLLYGLTYLGSLAFGIERLMEIPPLETIIAPLGLFIFGNFFSSLSEDILTRGYVYNHLNGKVSNWLLVLISASVYLLNHIYRLDDGVITLLYLFLLGVFFVVPLVITRRLWFTAGAHWAGNVTFFLTHEIWKTEEAGGQFSANHVLIVMLLLFIPLNYFFVRQRLLSRYIPPEQDGK